MFSQMIDQGLLNHLQEIDHLLIDLNDIHNIRMQEQEAQLNTFIQEGFIRPLSEREGLFLITQNQLNNFYESLKVFNNRLDNVEDQINRLKDNGLKFSQELHKQEYKINNLDKEKQALEKILQDYQNKNCSIIEEEEQFEGIFKQHIEEVKKNLQNTKIQELQDQIVILQNQLDERNKFISQLEINNNNQLQYENQHSIEIESQAQSTSDNEKSSNQNLIQTYEKKIQLLYSQVSFYKKQADDNYKQMKAGIESRMNIFEKELKKQQLLFVEDEDDQKGVIDIQFSNSRTLQIVELQKQVYFLEEERDKISKEFEDYKKQTENDLKEMKSHKIEVQEYKQKLEESLKLIKQRTNENLSKQQLHYEDFKSYALKIELLNQQNENLQNKLKEEQGKVNKVKASFEKEQKKLQDELALKNEIIRRFDPNSDIYKEQQEQIQQQTATIEQLRSDYQRIQHEKQSNEAKLNEKLEKLTEENKILLSMCESVPSQNESAHPLQAISGANDNKESIQQNIANNLFKQLYEYQKKKFQSLSLEYSIILSENQHSKSEKSRLIEENNKINQRLRQLQLTQKYNKKNNITNGTSSKKTPKSTLKEYEPLSEDIQNILSINKEYKLKIQELQLEIVGLRQEVESLRQMQDLEKSQSMSSSYQDVEMRPEQQDLTEQLLMIQALKQTPILKNLFKEN